MTAEQLRRSPLFSELPDEFLDRMIASAKEVALSRGSVLMDEGSEPDAMYIVQDGEMAITKRVGDANVLVNVLGPGEIVGELGLIHRRPRSATVTARTDATVLCIDVSVLDDLLSHPESARALLVSLTGRMDKLELMLRHHERMAALGSMTSGLLHEVNNPAAAVQRGATRLRGLLAESEEAAQHVDPEVAGRLAEVLAADRPALGPLERADAEEALRDHLEQAGVDRAWELAGVLADLGVAGDDLEALLAGLSDAESGAALRWLAVRARLARVVDEVVTGAARLGELVTSVKSFSHDADTPTTDVDVHAGLEQALTLLRHRLPDGVEVVREFDPDLPTIQGYPGDLNSVWTNLIDNALDAMGETGVLTIRTAAEADTVRVEVENTGEPIPVEILDRIFDPFFTTKPIGAGTGLGLATSFAIVTQRHHGDLTLEPTPTGTRATAVLPLSLPVGDVATS